mmetsp:Transcript_2325/g.4804  ORF Transcript_2325/g.4804 Transcript_2325/m.4804 type:complete len:207 (-) Transcript_2325:851-1471(-)
MLGREGCKACRLFAFFAANFSSSDLFHSAYAPSELRVRREGMEGGWYIRKKVDTASLGDIIPFRSNSAKSVCFSAIARRARTRAASDRNVRSSFSLSFLVIPPLPARAASLSAASSSSSSSSCCLSSSFPAFSPSSLLPVSECLFFRLAIPALMSDRTGSTLLPTVFLYTTPLISHCSDMAFDSDFKSSRLFFMLFFSSSNFTPAS